MDHFSSHAEPNGPRLELDMEMREREIAYDMWRFNNIRRPKTVGTRQNHWIISVGQLPLDPPGDFLLVVAPAQHYLYVAGPAQFLSSPDDLITAESLILPLLKLFLRGGEPSRYGLRRDPPPLAPWSWSTCRGEKNMELGQAVAKRLIHYGVLLNLQEIRVCTPMQEKWVQEVWSKLYHIVVELKGGLLPRDASRCHGCGLSSVNLLEPLVECLSCNSAFYHSADCQSEHWMRHQVSCIASRDAAISSGNLTLTVDVNIHDMDAHTHFRHAAHLVPDLIKALHLDLLGSPGPFATV
ncbi:hypothetical protein N0V82_004879 [Gnomoniopsis sp. IMI 355080]|nr:hypothetical protein N0V82_004879 [Gnomoniopsis sp. IMI 355080]